MSTSEIRRQILDVSTYVKQFQDTILTASQCQPSYYQANEVLLNFSPHIRQAVIAHVGRCTKLSAGISPLPTLDEFLFQAQKGMYKTDYYVNYSAPQGTYSAQEALRRCESAMLTSTDEMIYPPQGVCITAGGTGAINLVFEYIKQRFPTASVLVLGLSYYVFQFVAERLAIPCQQFTHCLAAPHPPRFLPTPAEVRAALTPNTKLLVIAHPSNPTGEYYSRAEIEELLDLTCERDLLILSDTVFADLVYDQEDFASFEEVALTKQCLERILTVRSYSKNYNLAGLRLGYLATACASIARDLSFISERIQCCPPTIYTDLINFISLLRHIEKETKRSPEQPLHTIIQHVSRWYEIGQGPNATHDIVKAYAHYNAFVHRNLSFYGRNFDLALETLGNKVSMRLDKKSAFNTLVKINALPANFFDFSVNLYLTTGIETQLGPCFGLKQSVWEQQLGFWLRITYTLMPDRLQEALHIFLVFLDTYMASPHRFLHFGLEF